jgi:hypothetical protein
MDEPQLQVLSPEGKLSELRVPVYVLHGETDDIIPSTESMWLAKDVPRRELRRVLITQAFSHVDPQKGVKEYQELRLVDFLGGVLRVSSGAPWYSLEIAFGVAKSLVCRWTRGPEKWCSIDLVEALSATVDGIFLRAWGRNSFSVRWRYDIL